jgi:hypothetical protein
MTARTAVFSLALNEASQGLVRISSKLAARRPLFDRLGPLVGWIATSDLGRNNPFRDAAHGGGSEITMMRTDHGRELHKKMSLVQLGERSTMRSDRLMGEIADNVFMRVMHRRIGGRKPRMLIMVWGRLGLQLAGRKTEVWMETNASLLRSTDTLGPYPVGGRPGTGGSKTFVPPFPSSVNLKLASV